jgi:hypothetical protein
VGQNVVVIRQLMIIAGDHYSWDHYSKAPFVDPGRNIGYVYLDGGAALVLVMHDRTGHLVRMLDNG